MSKFDEFKENLKALLAEYDAEITMGYNEYSDGHLEVSFPKEDGQGWDYYVLTTDNCLNKDNML